MKGLNSAACHKLQFEIQTGFQNFTNGKTKETLESERTLIDSAGVPLTDIREVISSCETKLNKVQGSNFLILGGTGFIGRWLISTLLEANSELNLNLNITLVTRNARQATEILGVKTTQNLEIVEFDLSREVFHSNKPFEIAIHGATPSVPRTGSKDHELVFAASVNGAETILFGAEKFRNSPRVINLSSGAVFGPQEPSMRNIPENSPYRINPFGYSKAKIETEKKLNAADLVGKIKNTNARLFAFFGPHLALDEHFAIGNFMRDGFRSKEILVKGNPATRRSYLYITNLIEALIRLIDEPDIKRINVGNDNPISIKDLAETFEQIFPKSQIKYQNDDSSATNYVPGVATLRERILIKDFLSLEDGIYRWKEWLRVTKWK